MRFTTSAYLLAGVAYANAAVNVSLLLLLIIGPHRHID